MIAGNDGLKCGNAAGSQVRCPRTAIADGWHQLPSRQQLVTRFGLFKSQCTPEVAASGEVSCACEQCGRCRAFLQGRLDGGPTWRQYEVWTRDYINSLAAYLWRRGEELGLEHLAVLEVGAGDGRLTAQLQAALAQLRPATNCCSVDLRCSDSGLSGCTSARRSGSLWSCCRVKKRWESTGQTLCCAPGCRWELTGRPACAPAPREWRGQLCDACCSSAREVVDGREDLPEQGQLRRRQRRTAGPEAASFVRVDVPEMSRLQLCCTDKRWLAFTKSQTVSLRRLDG